MSDSPTNTSSESYEAPSLVLLGTVHKLTLHGGCWWDKQFGGSDGFTFNGITVPISTCSS